MFDIFLTDISNDEHIADLITVDSQTEANLLCVQLQGYLRDDVEAHSVTSEDATPEAADEAERQALQSPLRHYPVTASMPVRATRVY